MKKKKNNRIKMLLILLLALSIGFALLTTVLKINGSARFAQQSWDVYWANPQVTEGSKSMVKPTIEDDGANSKKAKASWNVTFELPGEYYEFTIDAVNAGTLNAKITGIDTTVTPTLPEYISYTVVTYKVRIEYLVDEMDADTINAMNSDVSLTYNFGVTYTKSTESGMKTTPLSEEDLESFVALVEADPDLYRNPDQNPANRDIGIDAYGNVINLDNLRTTPSVFARSSKSYSVYVGDGDSYGELSGNDSGSSSRGLSWATASEFFDDGEWTLTLPAYIMIDGEDEFAPVTNLRAFFKGWYDDRTEDKKLTKLPYLPYTITYLEDSFNGIRSFDGPITLPSTVTYADDRSFNDAWKEDADKILRLHSSYPNYPNFGDDIEVEYYD